MPGRGCFQFVVFSKPAPVARLRRSRCGLPGTSSARSLDVALVESGKELKWKGTPLDALASSTCKRLFKALSPEQKDNMSSASAAECAAYLGYLRMQQAQGQPDGWDTLRPEAKRLFLQQSPLSVLRAQQANPLLAVLGLEIVVSGEPQDPISLDHLDEDELHLLAFLVDAVPEVFEGSVDQLRLKLASMPCLGTKAEATPAIKPEMTQNPQQHHASTSADNAAGKPQAAKLSAEVCMNVEAETASTLEGSEGELAAGAAAFLGCVHTCFSRGLQRQLGRLLAPPLYHHVQQLCGVAGLAEVAGFGDLRAGHGVNFDPLGHVLHQER